MDIFYRILADIILVVHIGYVSYAVFGQLAILIGWPLGWRWIRNPWFRVTHLIMILIVAFESWFEILCPLTTWERQLRGELDDGGSAMGQWTHDFLTIPESAFNVICMIAGVLVVATIFLVPPRFRKPASLAAPALDKPSEVAP